MQALKVDAVGVDASDKVESGSWEIFRDHLQQINVLMGSSIEKPPGWTNLTRHAHFACACDLKDIVERDWPEVYTALQTSIYGENEPLPLVIDDLSELVSSRPSGTISTRLEWTRLTDSDFERLVYVLLCNTPNYDNPKWLMQTRAPDRGRDISVYRTVSDELADTVRLRVIVQCKHWTSKSIAPQDVAGTVTQMSLWTNPRVDVLVIATSGRFTADAVTWVEQHNACNSLPRVEMWPESRLERLLAARPAMIASFGLR